ncbi:MAG: discoidin domain-containing protein [Planctomycetota bacterium]
MIPGQKLLSVAPLAVAVLFAGAHAQQVPFPGANATTPSRAFYFDWINNQYEGTNEEHTLINLDFFAWLHAEYGMALDIYSLDVGNVDDGPYTAGVGRLIPDHCGTLDSPEFREQFPNGFGRIAERAGSFGCRLGIWLGPDGFGTTPEEEQARIDMLVKLCRDHDFALFKLDAVAGGLRPEKQDALIRALVECRKHSPDLIVINERIDLGKVRPYVTTDLWEGAETYIDVFNSNAVTAPHHRAGALARGLLPGLDRLMEDHGVCLSSCLDYWEDDLVLQAFNRCLILAPEIYGSPWLLRDDEFPKLARLFNLHRRYGAILVNGMVLPEVPYGPFAVSRGDDGTRFITLRNLTWWPTYVEVALDASVGLTRRGRIELRRLHPYERVLGTYEWGSSAEVEIPPFRSCLLMASVEPIAEVGVVGCDYEVVRDVPGRPVELKLLSVPGTAAQVTLAASGRHFTKATFLGGADAPELIEGEAVIVLFPGEPLHEPWHRRRKNLAPCPVPADAEALYEATCFAADSNALEVRSLHRSGPTRIPQVERAREAFFNQPMFVNQGIWDKNLFDGDRHTFFMARQEGGALRIDFGEPLAIDRLVIRIRDREERDLNPELHRFAEDAVAEVSADLKSWARVGGWSGKGTIAVAKLSPSTPVRYVRIDGAPRRIAEIEAYRDGKLLDRSKWRASNLLATYRRHPAVAAWSGRFTLREVPRGSYLAVALNGEHGHEAAYVAVRVEERLLGAPDRAVSYPSNTWEYKNVDAESNTTYYVPLEREMAGKELEVVALLMEGGQREVEPVVYVTAYPPPYEAVELLLYEGP